MSSLVSCPVCGRIVAEWYINTHLDNKCSSFSSTLPEDIKPATIESNASASNGPLKEKPTFQTRLPAFKKPRPNPTVEESSNQTLEQNIECIESQKQDSISKFGFITAKELSVEEKEAKTEPFSLGKNSDTEPELQKSGDPVIMFSQLDTTNSAQRFTEKDMFANKKNNLAGTPELKQKLDITVPLSERLRPQSLEAFEGQEDIVGDAGILKKLIESDRIPSMILWGPPGSGKTSLAKIIANKTNAVFKEFSATQENISNVRKFMDHTLKIGLISPSKKRIIIFIDEIHRFNKMQQDIFLPYVERGKIILIGATTENPSFRLNPALLSRCRPFILSKLKKTHLVKIINKAILEKSKNISVKIEAGEKVVEYIANISDGDARSAINTVDIAVDAVNSQGQETISLHLPDIDSAIQKSHMNHNKDEHFDLISAFHKSMRGSDENATLYWLARMVNGGEDPVYIARRLVRFASEDIGVADSNALVVAVSTMTACSKIGYPECDTILAHCAVYMARAKKSIETYKAFNIAKQFVRNNTSYPVPLHLRNAPTKFMKDIGYSDGYKYNPDYEEGTVDQDYLPQEIKDTSFF
ncbi:hypothetical protein BB560_005541 [Smittium megazygosporum]|uniref:UBZ4-type domain-containing protein n=1 Tax=Smittium megazygosporum TaxID=133381 RepID=A0A2T9Z3S7_9FUNG|nr:hypothetical protein BB560_005541 [Smittium megazygosporum]